MPKPTTGYRARMPNLNDAKPGSDAELK